MATETPDGAEAAAACPAWAMMPTVPVKLNHPTCTQLLAVTQTNDAPSWSAMAVVAFVALVKPATMAQLVPFTTTVALAPVSLNTVY